MATHKRTAETSRELRLRIIKELRRNLRPVFKDREVIKVTSLLDNNGDPWEPGTGDPDQTEAFQDAVSNFIHGQIEPLADYVLLRSTYERWDVCTKAIGYLSLGAVVLQSVVFLGIGSATKILMMTPNVVWATVSLPPAVLVTIGYFVLGGVRYWSSNTLTTIARKYD